MEELLIETVKRRPVLYDIYSSNYSNQKIRQEAWEEVGRDLNISAENAKERWNKLRRCLCNAISRRRYKEAAEGGKKIPPWKFELQMNFLLPMLLSKWSQVEGSDRGSDSQMCQTSSSSDMKQDRDDDEYDLTDAAEELKNEELILDMEDYKIEEEENLDNDHKDINPKKRTKPKIDDQEDEDDIIETTQYKKERVQSHSTCFSGMDETDMFFLSMSRMTKHLPRFEQSKIKLTLSNAVLQAEIRHQENRLELNSEQVPLSRPDSSLAYVSDNSENNISEFKTEFSIK